MRSLQIKPELESLPLLYSFCEELGVDNRTMLPLEEAFVNIANYSGANNVLLTCSRNGDDLVFVFEDDGVAFDPTSHKPADMNEGESLRIGGQGIKIMLSMMDRVQYRRENNKNILTLTKSNCKK